MALFRRTDLGLHGELSDAKIRALAQSIRDSGGPGGGVGLWGNISGDIDNQVDLNEVRANLEALALLMDD